MSASFRRQTAATLLAALCVGCAHTPAQKRAEIEIAPPQCADFTFPVYFKERSEVLSVAALQVIADGAQRAKACRIDSIHVTGLAAVEGAPAAVADLSRRRAKVVAQALGANGLPAPSFEVEGKGEKGAVTRTGLFRPVNRRVEVLIHFGGS